MAKRTEQHQLRRLEMDKWNADKNHRPDLQVDSACTDASVHGLVQTVTGCLAYFAVS